MNRDAAGKRMCAFFSLLRQINSGRRSGPALRPARPRSGPGPAPGRPAPPLARRGRAGIAPLPLPSPSCSRCRRSRGPARQCRAAPGGRMRRLARVALLCLGCAVCSLLYGLSQLALSLEQEPGGGRERQAREPATPGAWRQAGSAGRDAAGSGRYAGPGPGAGGGSRRIPAGRAGRRGRSAPLSVPAAGGAGPDGRRRRGLAALSGQRAVVSVRSLSASRGPGTGGWGSLKRARKSFRSGAVGDRGRPRARPRALSPSLAAAWWDRASEGLRFLLPKG